MLDQPISYPSRGSDAHRLIFDEQSQFGSFGDVKGLRDQSCQQTASTRGSDATAAALEASQHAHSAVMIPSPPEALGNPRTPPMREEASSQSLPPPTIFYTTAPAEKPLTSVATPFEDIAAHTSEVEAGYSSLLERLRQDPASSPRQRIPSPSTTNTISRSDDAVAGQRLRRQYQHREAFVMTSSPAPIYPQPSSRAAVYPPQSRTPPHHQRPRIPATFSGSSIAATRRSPSLKYRPRDEGVALRKRVIFGAPRGRYSAKDVEKENQWLFRLSLLDRVPTRTKYPAHRYRGPRYSFDCSELAGGPAKQDLLSSSPPDLPKSESLPGRSGTGSGGHDSPAAGASSADPSPNVTSTATTAMTVTGGINFVNESHSANANQAQPPKRRFSLSMLNPFLIFGRSSSMSLRSRSKPEGQDNPGPGDTLPATRGVSDAASCTAATSPLASKRPETQAVSNALNLSQTLASRPIPKDNILDAVADFFPEPPTGTPQISSTSESFPHTTSFDLEAFIRESSDELWTIPALATTRERMGRGTKVSLEELQRILFETLHDPDVSLSETQCGELYKAWLVLEGSPGYIPPPILEAYMNGDEGPMNGLYNVLMARENDDEPVNFSFADTNDLYLRLAGSIASTEHNSATATVTLAATTAAVIEKAPQQQQQQHHHHQQGWKLPGSQANIESDNGDQEIAQGRKADEAGGSTVPPTAHQEPPAQESRGVTADDRAMIDSVVTSNQAQGLCDDVPEGPDSPSDKIITIDGSQAQDNETRSLTASRVAADAMPSDKQNDGDSGCAEHIHLKTDSINNRDDPINDDAVSSTGTHSRLTPLLQRKEESLGACESDDDDTVNTRGKADHRPGHVGKASGGPPLLAPTAIASDTRPQETQATTTALLPSCPPIFTSSLPDTMFAGVEYRPRINGGSSTNNSEERHSRLPASAGPDVPTSHASVSSSRNHIVATDPKDIDEVDGQCPPEGQGGQTASSDSGGTNHLEGPNTEMQLDTASKSLAPNCSHTRQHSSQLADELIHSDYVPSCHDGVTPDARASDPRDTQASPEPISATSRSRKRGQRDPILLAYLRARSATIQPNSPGGTSCRIQQRSPAGIGDSRIDNGGLYRVPSWLLKDQNTTNDRLNDPPKDPRLSRLAVLEQLIQRERLGTMRARVEQNLQQLSTSMTGGAQPAEPAILDEDTSDGDSDYQGNESGNMEQHARYHHPLPQQKQAQPQSPVSPSVAPQNAATGDGEIQQQITPAHFRANHDGESTAFSGSSTSIDLRSLESSAYRSRRFDFSKTRPLHKLVRTLTKRRRKHVDQKQDETLREQGEGPHYRPQPQSSQQQYQVAASPPPLTSRHTAPLYSQPHIPGQPMHATVAYIGESSRIMGRAQTMPPQQVAQGNIPVGNHRPAMPGQGLSPLKAGPLSQAVSPRPPEIVPGPVLGQVSMIRSPVSAQPSPCAAATGEEGSGGQFEARAHPPMVTRRRAYTTPWPDAPPPAMPARLQTMLTRTHSTKGHVWPATSTEAPCTSPTKIPPPLPLEQQQQRQQRQIGRLGLAIRTPEGRAITQTAVSSHSRSSNVATSCNAGDAAVGLAVASGGPTARSKRAMTVGTSSGESGHRPRPIELIEKEVERLSSELNQLKLELKMRKRLEQAFRSAEWPTDLQTQPGHAATDKHASTISDGEHRLSSSIPPLGRQRGPHDRGQQEGKHRDDWGSSARPPTPKHEGNNVLYQSSLSSILHPSRQDIKDQLCTRMSYSQNIGGYDTIQRLLWEKYAKANRRPGGLGQHGPVETGEY